MSTISSGDEDREGPESRADGGRSATPAEPVGEPGTRQQPGRGDEPRARVRVVRPGGGSAGAPPMPVAPPNALPPWLDPATAAGPAAAGPTMSGPMAGGPTTPGPTAAGPTTAGATTPTGPGTTTGPGAAGADPDGDAFDPDLHLAPEERELRELLHRAVGELKPAPGALDLLRRAVPQRRQHRRRVYGSAALTAALCLIGGLALHAADGSVLSASGPGTAQSYGDAAQNHSASGGAGISSSPSYSPLLPNPSLGSGGNLGGVGTPGGGSTNAVSPVPGSPGSGRLQPSGQSSGQGNGTAPPYTTPSPGAPIVPIPSTAVDTSSRSTTGSFTPTAAECVQSQLGAGTATVAAADSSGIVYGTFLVTNVSAKTCVVSQQGTVAVLSVNGTDASWKIGRASCRERV